MPEIPTPEQLVALAAQLDGVRSFLGAIRSRLTRRGFDARHLYFRDVDKACALVGELACRARSAGTPRRHSTGFELDREVVVCGMTHYVLVPRWREGQDFCGDGDGI